MSAFTGRRFRILAWSISCLAMLGILSGLVQILFGLAKLVRLINYIPYPVASGYLSAVGVIIITSQLPKLLVTQAGTPWYQPQLRPWTWDMHSLTIAAVTIVVSLIAPRLTRKIPGVILGILAGVLTYFALASQNPALLEVDNNPLVIGPLGAATELHLAGLGERWRKAKTALSNTDTQLNSWWTAVKNRADCQDCTFNQQERRLVKPAEAKVAKK